MTAGLDASVLDQFTADQLAHAAAAKRERERLADDGEPTYADEVGRITANADPATTAVFDAHDPAARARQYCSASRAVGIDDDLIGCNIIVGMVASGTDPADAAKVVQDAGIDWRRRTHEERLRAVAADMLAEGYDKNTVAALAEVAS